MNRQVPRFLKVQTSDSTINRLQDNVARVVVPLVLQAQSPILQGHLLTGVALAASTTTRVQHGLGRPIVGWFPVRIRGSATIYDEQDLTLPGQSNAAVASLQLLLVASANVTVDLWVF